MSKQPNIDQLDLAITDILANPDVVPSSVDASLADLLIIARDLSAMPRPDFKARLRSELERKASMSTKDSSISRGIPHSNAIHQRSGGGGTDSISSTGIRRRRNRPQRPRFGRDPRRGSDRRFDDDDRWRPGVQGTAKANDAPGSRGRMPMRFISERWMQAPYRRSTMTENLRRAIWSCSRPLWQPVDYFDSDRAELRRRPGAQHHNVRQSYRGGKTDRFHDASVRGDGNDEGGWSGRTGETFL